MCLYTHIYIYTRVCKYFDPLHPERVQTITTMLTVWNEYDPAMVSIQ